MSKVISLANYRRRSRQEFLERHGNRLDRFVEQFVGQHLDVDFRQLADDFQAAHHDQSTASWDYVQFREVLTEALDEAFGVALYRELSGQRWFDERLITQDEVIDRCVSTFVLARCAYALTSP